MPSLVELDHMVIEKNFKSDKRRHGVLSAKLYKDQGCLHVIITGPAFKFYKKKQFRKVNEKVRIINYGNFLIYQREVLFTTLVKNLIFLAFTIKAMDLFEVVCYCTLKLLEFAELLPMIAGIFGKKFYIFNYKDQ